MDVDVQLPEMFTVRVVIADDKRVSAGAKTINVKALPESGKPLDFSGAVGF
jgi:hypothetical protein